MMGHILEHVALELQTLAGMPVGFGRTRETATDGIYQVVFQYQYEQAGRYAGRAAFRLCQSLVDTGSYPAAELEQDLRDLREIREQSALGPSTESIIKEAEALDIPWMENVEVDQAELHAAEMDQKGEEKKLCIHFEAD